MKLLEIYKRIGKQPLKVTRRKEAIVIIGDEEYKINKIRYKDGKFIGFEANKNDQWFDESVKPQENKWIVVKDKKRKRME